jgi:hypothetical protein
VNSWAIAAFEAALRGKGKSELDGDDDDLVDGEQIWRQANERVAARLRKPT